MRRESERHLPRRKFDYPWRAGNRFELLVDGDRFYPAMLDAIRRADHHVLLEMYLVESGRVAERFIAALLETAQRGVPVYLLLDGFGASGLSRPDRQRLHGAGVRLAWFNPIDYARFQRNLYRDHRKLLCIDGEIAFVGGAGIADEFSTEGGGRAWHDTMVRIEGPVVADWQELFKCSWDRWFDTPLGVRRPPGHPLGDGATGRLTHAMGLPRMEIKRSLLARIARSRRRVWIATGYFIPSRKLRRFLHRAARRGVDVRLLLSGPETDHPAVRQAGRRFYARLLRHGVRIFEFQPRFLHAKVALVDDWVSTGSSNMDRWNFRWNLEANQEIDDRRFASAVEEFFHQDFPQSREYSYDEWRQRSRWWRLLERFWGRVDLWMERLRPPK